jgi:hypothetical protein
MHEQRYDIWIRVLGPVFSSPNFDLPVPWTRDIDIESPYGYDYLLFYNTSMSVRTDFFRSHFSHLWRRSVLQLHPQKQPCHHIVVHRENVKIDAPFLVSSRFSREMPEANSLGKSASSIILRTSK